MVEAGAGALALRLGPLLAADDGRGDVLALVNEVHVRALVAHFDSPVVEIRGTLDDVIALEMRDWPGPIG